MITSLAAALLLAFSCIVLPWLSSVLGASPLLAPPIGFQQLSAAICCQKRHHGPCPNPDTNTRTPKHMLLEQVEDMDLSLRCHLAGWKSIYVNDVTSWNEVCTDTLCLHLALAVLHHDPRRCRCWVIIAVPRLPSLLPFDV